MVLIHGAPYRTIFKRITFTCEQTSNINAAKMYFKFVKMIPNVDYSTLGRLITLNNYTALGKCYTMNIMIYYLFGASALEEICFLVFLVWILIRLLF